MFCKYVKDFHIEIMLTGIAFLSLLPIPNARAFRQGLFDTLQVHGFASQGFVQTSDNNFFGKSEDGSFEFTELGLNTSFRPTPDLQFSAQILSRRAGEGDKGDIRLDYGLIDYNVISNGSTSVGFRLGRIKNPLGLYNDTRDVAFTRPSVFLPQSIYFDRTRNLALSADGVNIYTEHRIDSGNVFFQFGVVAPNIDGEETIVALLGSQRPGRGRLEEKTSYITQLIFEQEGGRIRLGISGLILNVQFKPATADTASGSIRFTPIIFSAQYNAEFWSLTSEYALRNTKYKNVGLIPDFNRTGESYYLQGSYQLIKNLEAFIRYDALFQDRDDRSGLKAEVQHSRFAKDWTIGLRWDMTESWMSRIEYHNVDGTGWLAPLDNPPSSTKRRWDMYSMLVSYRF